MLFVRDSGGIWPLALALGKQLGLGKVVRWRNLVQQFLPLRIIEVLSLTGTAPVTPTQVKFDPFTGSSTSRVEVKKNLIALLGSSILFLRVALYALSDELSTAPMSIPPPNPRVSPVGRVHCITNDGTNIWHLNSIICCGHGNCCRGSGSILTTETSCAAANECRKWL